MELNSELAEELINQGFESADLDYKVEFDNSENAWMEIAKDVFGMANYGGGHIVIGVEDGTFKPIGVDVTFHKDTQEWVDRISKWVTGKISLLYLEYVTDVKGKQKK
jgi:predicted HTH transcriptional regulator